MTVRTVAAAALLALASFVSQPGRAAADVGRIVYPRAQAPVLTARKAPPLVVKSLLDVKGRLRFGEFVWNDSNVPAGPIRVRIDLPRQMISVFRGGHEIGTAVVLYGTDGKPTPLGTFPIMEKARRHRSTLYDASMPFMLRLTGDGVAIHASNVRHGSATHGCIGVPAGFAERLFAQVKRGDLVTIV